MTPRQTHIRCSENDNGALEGCRERERKVAGYLQEERMGKEERMTPLTVKQIHDVRFALAFIMQLSGPFAQAI